MFSKKILFTLGLACAMISTSVFAANTTWTLGETDSSERFTNVNNASSVWTLGYYDSASTFHSYTYMEIASLGLYGWNDNGNNDSHGNFLKNAGTTTYEGSPVSSYWEPGAIILGSSPNNDELLAAIFTAPETAYYQIDFNGFGRELNLPNIGTSVNLKYIANGTYVSTGQVVGFAGAGTYPASANSVTSTYSDVVYLEAGQTFQVLIDNGFDINGSANQSENLGLTFAVSSVPEPSGLIAIFTGVAGLVGFSIRRRK